MTKPTGKINPTYRLTERDRYDIAVMVWMMKTSHRLGRRWTRTSIAEAFGVSRKTINKCEERYLING